MEENHLLAQANQFEEDARKLVEKFGRKAWKIEERGEHDSEKVKEAGKAMAVAAEDNKHHIVEVTHLMVF